MDVFRDYVTGEAVTWCADRDVRSVITGSGERLVRTVDIGADMYYKNNAAAERQGLGWVHPYDRDRIAALHAELVVVEAWHRAGGNA